MKTRILHRLNDRIDTLCKILQFITLNRPKVGYFNPYNHALLTHEEISDYEVSEIRDITCFNDKEVGNFD